MLEAGVGGEYRCKHKTLSLYFSGSMRMCAALFPKHAFLKDEGRKLVSDHMTLILVLLLPLNAQPTDDYY